MFTLPATACRGAAQLRAHHVAERGFDRGPILDLIRGEPQPALETVDLAVVEQPSLSRRGRRRCAAATASAFRAAAARARRTRTSVRLAGAGAGLGDRRRRGDHRIGRALERHVRVRRGQRIDRLVLDGLKRGLDQEPVGLGGAIRNLRFGELGGRAVGQKRPAGPLGEGAVAGKRHRGGAENDETSNLAFGQASTPHTMNQHAVLSQSLLNIGLTIPSRVSPAWALPSACVRQDRYSLVIVADV